MTSAPAPPRAANRLAILAVLLSGLAPGVGHLYVGRPWRGAAFVGVLAGSSVLLVRLLPRDWDMARLAILINCMVVLLLLADAGRLARRAPRPFVPGRVNAPWVYAVGVFVTGVVAPAALTAWLRTEVGLVRVPDERMQTAGLFENDWVVVDERSQREAPPVRGAVVLVAADGTSELARVVEPAGARGGGEVMVSFHPRRRDEQELTRVPASRVTGRVAYVLVPGDGDVLRVGEPPR